MKKLIVKLGAFIILSIILSANLQVFAADCPGGVTDAGALKTNIGGTQCIKDNDKKDKTKIITIIEEPLPLPEYKDKFDNKKGFEARTCIRKTILCEIKKENDKKEKRSAAELLDSSATCGADEICDEVMVIISGGGTTMIEGYISLIYTWAAGFVGLIAVAVIIISSMQISMSGGDTQAVENSKERILKSLAGLAVLFLSGLILYTINPNFFTK